MGKRISLYHYSYDKKAVNKQRKTPPVIMPGPHEDTRGRADERNRENASDHDKVPH